MKRNKPTTAKELMDQLENDPVHQEKMIDSALAASKQKALLREDERDLVKEIRSLGYEIESVWDFVNNAPHPVLENRFVGSYQKAYPILVKHLQIQHHKAIREGIIRALTENDANHVASEPLLHEFYNEKDDELRWVLANALSTVLNKDQQNKHPEYKEILNKGNMP